jgi:hypothetical protein
VNFKCLFGHKWDDNKCKTCGKTRPKPRLRSFGIENKGQYTYEYYAASSAEEARYFLSFRKVSRQLYYIQVETPEGVWGVDNDGLYLVALLPFQKDVSLKQCDGEVSPTGYSLGMQMAVLGKVDNFICEVTCGSCGYKWKDGVRFNRETIVKCPKCKKYNCVDTSGKIEYSNFGSGGSILKMNL